MRDDLLYREEILEHYHASPHRGRLECPHLHCELQNPLCGDHIRLELELDADRTRIARARFDGDGCAISQASASLLACHLEGLDVDAAGRLSAEDALKLLDVPLSPARMKCGLLAWKALRTLLPAPAAG